MEKRSNPAFPLPMLGALALAQSPNGSNAKYPGISNLAPLKPGCVIDRRCQVLVCTSNQMNFWRNVEEVSGLEGGFSWAGLLFLVVILIVFHFRPNERRYVRSTLILFATSLAGLLAAAAYLSYGMPSGGWIYLLLRSISFFLLAAAIINVARVLAFTIVLRAVRLEPPDIAQDVIVALVYLAIAIALLSQCGVDLRGIVATSAVITAVIGFSLQDSLGNIIGGTFLQVEQMIRVGDWIRIDDLEGKVKATRWRILRSKHGIGNWSLFPTASW